LRHQIFRKTQHGSAKPLANSKGLRTLRKPSVGRQFRPSSVWHRIPMKHRQLWEVTSQGEEVSLS
jgi:hypothetical protein